MRFWTRKSYTAEAQAPLLPHSSRLGYGSGGVNNDHPKVSNLFFSDATTDGALPVISSYGEPKESKSEPLDPSLLPSKQILSITDKFIIASTRLSSFQGVEDNSQPFDCIQHAAILDRARNRPDAAEALARQLRMPQNDLSEAENNLIAVTCHDYLAMTPQKTLDEFLVSPQRSTSVKKDFAITPKLIEGFGLISCMLKIDGSDFKKLIDIKLHKNVAGDLSIEFCFPAKSVKIITDKTQTLLNMEIIEQKDQVSITRELCYEKISSDWRLYAHGISTNKHNTEDSMSSHGIMTFTNGTTFTGKLERKSMTSLPDGIGTITTNTLVNNRYTGEFSAGQMHGDGILEMKNTATDAVVAKRYVGAWKESAMDRGIIIHRSSNSQLQVTEVCSSVKLN